MPTSTAGFRVAALLSVALEAGCTGRGQAQAPPPQPAQHGANPTVSPDGRRIASISDRSGTGDLYLMNADGGDVRRLTSDGGHKGRAYWSADGRRLLFNVTAKDTVRVISLSPEGDSVIEVGRFAGRGALPLGDGLQFASSAGPWTGTQLFLSRADGSVLRQLTSDHAAYWCPAVSPHGDQVAATRMDSTGMQIWLVNIDGSGARALTRFSKAQGGPQCPAVSPDGRRIAVQSEVSDPQDSTRQIGHIWVVDAVTGQATWLAEHSAPYRDELPAWFPDGSRIALQSDRTGRWEVWVMNADGTGARQLTR